MIQAPSTPEVGSPVSTQVEVVPDLQETGPIPVRTVSRGNKADLLLSMVAREEGASLDELVAALGNLAHSIRASISVESRKRGLKIECVNSRYYLRSAA